MPGLYVRPVVLNTTVWGLKTLLAIHLLWIKAKLLTFLSRTSQIYSQQNVEQQVCWLRTENEIAISLQVIIILFTVWTLTVCQLSKDYHYQTPFITMTALNIHLSVEGWDSNHFYVENPFVVIHPLHSREWNL